MVCSELVVPGQNLLADRAAGCWLALCLSLGLVLRLGRFLFFGLGWLGIHLPAGLFLGLRFLLCLRLKIILWFCVFLASCVLIVREVITLDGFFNFDLHLILILGKLKRRRFKGLLVHLVHRCRKAGRDRQGNGRR